jgi:hypothetical protein
MTNFSNVILPIIGGVGVNSSSMVPITCDPNDVSGAIGQSGGSIALKTFMSSATSDFNNTSAFTFEDVIALAADYNKVQIILNNPSNVGRTTAQPLYTCSVAPLADRTIATANAATWTSVAFAGRSASEYLLTDHGSTADKYRFLLVSDWIDIASIARTDGGLFPLLGVRVWINGGNPISMNGDGSNSMAAWETHSSGRTWQTYRNAGGNNATTAQSSMARTARLDVSPIWGIRFIAKSGKITTFYAVGDSISEQSSQLSGATYGDNWIFRLANLKHSADYPVEVARLGKTGKDSETFTDSFIDLFNERNDLVIGKNISVDAGGTGYAVNDLIFINGGGVVKVTTVNTGAVTAAVLVQNPVIYNYQIGNREVRTVATTLGTSGAGTGAAFVVFYNHRGALAADNGIVFLPAFSPNDNTGTLVAANFDRAKSNVNRAIDRAHELGFKVAVWSPLPAGLPDGASGSARTGWGSSDSLRRSYTAEVLGGVFANADTLLDFSFLENPTLNATGQGCFYNQYGFTGDWIHPSDVAGTDMANYAAGVVSKP